MVNNERSVWMNRRQIENRRRKQLRERIFLFTRMVILIVLVLCIRNIYARLEEIKLELKRVEIQQYGTVQTREEVQILEETDYVSSIDTWEVGNPVDRTEDEVLQRLGELAQESSMIDEIYQSLVTYYSFIRAQCGHKKAISDLT